MKASFRKILVTLSTVAMALCLLFGGVFAFSQGALAKADESLETEFTNNGQFALSHYDNNEVYAYNFVDGTDADLPAGSTGSVVKMLSAATSGAPYINIDFTASKINAKFVYARWHLFVFLVTYFCCKYLINMIKCYRGKISKEIGVSSRQIHSAKLCKIKQKEISRL